jgi:hypothetical protein
VKDQIRGAIRTQGWQSADRSRICCRPPKSG